jgi:hypothetical protein
MAKKVIPGEAHDILKVMPSEQLRFFYEIRNNEKQWDALQSYVRSQKAVKLDQMYRIRRPKTQDDLTKNAIEHEYCAARIAGDVLLLHLAENAGSELERRDRSNKKK